MNNNKVWVVIAAYNEELAITETLKKILTQVSNVVVVDDCSSDRTVERALNAGAHVLHHPINLGQGAALQTGIEYAMQNDCKYIITFDADGQHNAEEIIPMLTALQQSKAEVVLGSRFLGRAHNIPLQRKILLKLAIAFTQLTSGTKFTDVHNGFRILTSKFCESFKFKQNRMAHASEILDYISKNNIPYLEHPVTIFYTKYSIQHGQKSSNAIRVVLEMFMRYMSP